MTHECRRDRSRQRKDPGRREDVGEVERDDGRRRRSDDDRIGHTQVVPRRREGVTQQSSRHHARSEEGEQGREAGGGKGDTDEHNGEHEPADPARVIRPRRSGRDVLPNEIGYSERQRDGKDEGGSRHTWNVADRRCSALPARRTWPRSGRAPRGVRHDVSQSVFGVSHGAARRSRRFSRAREIEIRS